MSRPLFLLNVIFIFILAIPGYAEDVQSNRDETSRTNRARRTLILDIDTRVLDLAISDSGIRDEEQVVVWNESHRRSAIPGSPVGIKMAGSNIVVALQFTPVIRRNSNVLIAQGQIWVDDPGKGISYYSSIQTIPMEFGEPIFFFPLGQAGQLDSIIEIMLVVNIHTEDLINSAETAANTGNDR